MSRRAAELALVAAALLAASCAKEQRPPPIEPSALETRAAPVPAPSPSADRDAACGPHALTPDLHYAAEGLCVRVVAYGQGDLWSIAFAPNGDLLAVNGKGEVRRYRDVDRDGVFASGPPETITWAKTGATGDQECRFDVAELYCRSKDGVKRWRYDAEKGGAGELVLAPIPERERRSRHPIGVWDGQLYVSNSVVKRFDVSKYVPGRPLTWKDGVLLEQGVKVPSAIGRGPRRMVALDDEGVRALDADETVVRLPPGSAASAMAFPDPAISLALPAKWHDGAFVARHGSRTAGQPTGHDVIWGSLSSPAEVVFGAGRNGVYRGGEWSWKLGDAADDSVSPTGLAISHVDGALYVTSAGGAIYRIAMRGR